MKELNALIQEIVDFGDVISFTDDMSDPNFQNACNLFSQYLDWRFQEVKEKLENEGVVRAGLLNNNDLESLNRLMAAPRRSAEACITWTRELFHYCVELQRNKAIAA